MSLGEAPRLREYPKYEVPCVQYTSFVSHNVFRYHLRKSGDCHRVNATRYLFYQKSVLGDLLSAWSSSGGELMKMLLCYCILYTTLHSLCTTYQIMVQYGIDVTCDMPAIISITQTRRSTSRSPRTVWRLCSRLTRPSWPSTKTRSTRSGRRSGSS